MDIDALCLSCGNPSSTEAFSRINTVVIKLASIKHDIYRKLPLEPSDMNLHYPMVALHSLNHHTPDF